MHVSSHFHLLFPGCPAPSGVVIEIIRRHRKLCGIEQIQIFLFRHPVAVGRLLIANQKKRTTGIPPIQPLHGQIRGQIRDISRVVFGNAVFDESRIVIIPLTRQDIPVVKPLGIGYQMPLPGDGGLITGLFQQFHDRLLVAIEGGMIVLETILMTMLARQKDGATWSTYRV